MAIESQAFNHREPTQIETTELTVVAEICEKICKEIKHIFLGSKSNPSSLREAGNLLIDILKNFHGQEKTGEKLASTLGHSVNATTRIILSPITTTHRLIRAITGNLY